MTSHDRLPGRVGDSMRLKHDDGRPWWFEGRGWVLRSGMQCAQVTNHVAGRDILAVMGPYCGEARSLTGTDGAIHMDRRDSALDS